jgi:hypothetical protein
MWSPPPLAALAATLYHDDPVPQPDTPWDRLGSSSMQAHTAAVFAANASFSEPAVQQYRRAAS